MWLPYEIHPETPGEGVSLEERFRGHDVAGMYKSLRQQGKNFGIEFGELKLLSNSHYALQAGEYARDKGQYHLFHKKVFHAYFTKLEDIGDPKIIGKLAAECNLDPADLAKSVAQGHYRDRLEEAQKQGKKYNVTGVPAFLIEGKLRIVGAQPIDVFRKVLSKAGAKKS